MPGAVDDDQFRVGPRARQCPCIVDRRAKVEAAIDQYTRDAGEASDPRNSAPSSPSAVGASNRARAAVPPTVTLHLDSVSHAGVGTYITGACAAATITRVSTEDNAPETSAARRLVNAGSDLAGSGTAAALGMLVGGPIGAFAGAAAGPLLTHTLKELATRVLSRREQVRVGATFAFAASAIRGRLEAGETLRDDGFFDASNVSGRPTAEEVFEAVLLTAQREPEERKVEYLGYLLGNVSFEPVVDRSLASWAISIAQELSWTQFILLSTIGRAPDDFVLPDIEIGNSGLDWSSWGVAHQLADLGWAKRELIGGRTEKTERMGLPRINTRLRNQRLQDGGSLLFSLMELNKIPSDDVAPIIATLAALEEGGGGK